MAARNGKNGKHRPSEIIWINVRVKLGDLKPWDENPRMSTKEDAKNILASFEEFGQSRQAICHRDRPAVAGVSQVVAIPLLEG